MGNSELYITEDGSHSIFSQEYGVSYHSKFGAFTETQHVFINASLRFKAVLQKNISILEIGFGTGLNALVTFFEAKKRNLEIKYVGVEAYPISVEQAKELNYSSFLDLEINPDIFLQLHEISWNSPVQLTNQFKIEKVKKKFESIDYNNHFDIIYFDAFAPEAQPELWNEEMMRKMYNALLPDGILVTYCAKGVVKRTMKKVGFTVEALPGPPGKREMTRAMKILSL